MAATTLASSSSNLNNTKQTNPDTHNPLPDGGNDKPTGFPYFSKWSRHQVQRAMENGQVQSLYVENLSLRWTPTDIYRIMSRHGDVVDVYIPNKQSRSGLRFGFVRFQGVRDLQGLLAAVNRVQVENGSVKANIARRRSLGLAAGQRSVPQQHPRSNKRDGRTYATVIRGNRGIPEMREDQGQGQGFSFIPSTDINLWLSRCAVGIAKDPMKMESIGLLWKLHGITDVEVVDMGGDSVLVCFLTREAMLQFSQEQPDWVPLWFKSFLPWKQGDKATNRRCWLTLRGVPLNAWCHDFFRLIGAEFGELLQLDEETAGRRRLGSARIEILTELETFINKKLQVSIAHQTYTVMVVEDRLPYSDACTLVLSESAMDDRTLDGDSDGDRSEAERCSRDGKGEDFPADLQDTTQDPFDIMEILENNPGNDGGQINLDIATLKSVDLPLVMRRNSGEEFTCSQCNQPLDSKLKATTGVLQSSGPLNLTNNFGPLMDEGEGESVLPVNATPENSPKSPIFITSSASTPWSSNKSKGATSVSRSSSYLVRRLEAAVKAARVSQRKKYKKITDTGSVTSSLSSTDNAIRRVNERLNQSPQPQNEPSVAVSFQLQEAERTVNVGDALQWDKSGDLQGVVDMANELVVKEAVEWSAARAHV
ncbi:hypothetical protein Tsubulata_027269 [Turnera subulata]|uniref:RRM domain-containing protein n=1 Tax=Turnera subulata TaxID=218843 RepID=A0A9Q0JGU3_9ROSI|nr:hypothetical protein Tsubulata_027269 [Turnera subulata]